MEQTRRVMRNIGIIDPVSVQEYSQREGYKALKKALSMTGNQIIEEINDSKIRGRGGAGFPVATKWSMVYKTQADKKYVICNADEGEPATNKDRVLMSGDPHSVLEGMAIAGYTVGADKGYIYLRAEYPYLFPVLEEAISQAKNANCLGKNILGSNFNFDIEVVSGGGAYICGEETALIESIEGQQGEPRFKPPYPGIEGLHHKPTLVNNVETFANITLIVLEGAKWFKSLGTPGSTGTKLFTLSGNLKRRGVMEFPMGVNLKDIIYEAGGGVTDDNGILGVHIGGASGPIINSSQIDRMLDMDNGIGTGDVMVIDNTNDILDVVENLTSFFVHEGCGKCTPCREGNTRLLQIIQNIRAGKGQFGDIELLQELGETMVQASNCGLGQTSPIPILSTIENFRSTYERAIERGQQTTW